MTVRRRLSTQYSIQDAGQPNKQAIGIVNDAFDETVAVSGGCGDTEDTDRDVVSGAGGLAPDESYGDSSAALDSSDSVNTNALLTGSAATTVDATGNAVTGLTATTDSGVVAAVPADDMTDCGKDPFDTSEFDSAAFDAFANKFDSTSGAATADNSTASYDPFASPMKSVTGKRQDDTEADVFDIFDPYASRPTMKTPKNTPAKGLKDKQKDSFDDYGQEDSLKIVIRAKMKDNVEGNKGVALAPPLLLPPPKSPKMPTLEGMDLMPDDNEVVVDEFEAFFGTSQLPETAQHIVPAGGEQEWPTAFGAAAGVQRTDSTKSPQTPLYDKDTSQPLEDFPPKYLGDGWEMMLRYPNKKKLTVNRCWKKIYVKFLAESCIFQLFNKKEENSPFQETPLQASYSLSDISLQQYDHNGKIFTIKLQYIFYRERVGVRPGQIAKVMQGQITSMGQFAKLGIPLEHAPQADDITNCGKDPKMTFN